MENAAVAVRGMEELQRVSADRRITSMTAGQVRSALAKTVWEGRMEEVLPGIFVDGAHNEDGIRAFTQSVKADGCKGRRILVFSAVADKDIREMTAILRDGGLFGMAAVVGIHDKRAAETKRLRELLMLGGNIGEVMLFAGMEEALPELRKRKKEDDFIYMVGSLYLIGEVKALLRRRTDD